MYPDLTSKAAALLYFIAKGHVCPDGNKRTAFILATVFLMLNGHVLSGDYPQRAELIAEAVALPSDQRGDALAMLKQWLDQTVTPDKDGPE